MYREPAVEQTSAVVYDGFGAVTSVPLYYSVSSSRLLHSCVGGRQFSWMVSATG